MTEAILTRVREMVERVYRELAHLRARFDRTIRHNRDLPEPRYGPGWEHGFDQREHERQQRMGRELSPSEPLRFPKPLRAPERTRDREQDRDFGPSR